MSVKLNKPVKPNIEKLSQYISQVNENEWYTNFGPLHQLLTKRLESYLGVENLLLVSNGTLALQIAYKTFNSKKALTTPFSFVATTSSLLWEGVETSFCDIDDKSWNLCSKNVGEILKTEPSIDTIVATHVYGNACDIEKFEKISKNNNVKIIYDAAHAFGVNYLERSILSFGDASTISFHATKIFHTVEGGAIIFKHKTDYEKAKKLINFGINDGGNITEIGVNAKLNEYQCAVGLTLLDDIDKIIEHRVKLFKLYKNELTEVVSFPVWSEKSNFNGSYMPILLKSTEERELIQNILDENNIQSRRYFSPSLDEIFNELKVYSIENSKKISKQVLCLPLHYYMTADDVLFISNVIKDNLQ